MPCSVEDLQVGDLVVYTMGGRSTHGTVSRAEHHGLGSYEVQLADGMGVAKLNARAARKVLDKQQQSVPELHYTPEPQPAEPYHAPEHHSSPEPSHPPAPAPAPAPAPEPAAPKMDISKAPAPASESDSGDEKEL